MSTKIRYCLLCQQHDRRTSRWGFIRISNVERETKLREGYRRQHNGDEINQSVLNQFVHQRCYNEIIQDLPSIDQSHSADDIATNANEQNHNEKHDQESNVQSHSIRVSSNSHKSVQERSKRACVICHSYAYSYTNRIRQIGSNLMANRLAQGFLHRYKRPYGKSLLDAYIHDVCYRKIYGSYRNQSLSKLRNENHIPFRSQVNPQLEFSPHETRSQSNCNRSKIDKDESINTSITDLFSTPFNISVATTNPAIELSARSCLLRPCIQQLSPEQVEFYTKRNALSKEIHEDDSVILDTLPITYSTTQPSSIDNVLINTNEIDLSSSHSTFIPSAKTITTAEIRYRHSNSNDSRPLITNPIINARSEKYLIHLDKLYHWLIEQLKSSEYPMPFNEALTKYHEFTAEDDNNQNKDAKLCRLRLRNRLEKFYPNEFIFIVPNKRDGTYIALNDITHYVCSAIKKAHEDKDQATKTSMISSIIVPPTVEDEKRKTCETIMNSIRKIRLYMHDSKQINCRPSNLMQNFIGLITASDRQFDKISHNYDFYRMIDENLFQYREEQDSKKLNNKTHRNMSLASDLISARHDHQISQKHYLLADEIAKETFHCTPKQVITLLNHYGHTCSYRSYTRMKTILQRTTNQIGETLIIDQAQPSDIEIEMMDL